MAPTTSSAADARAGAVRNRRVARRRSRWVASFGAAVMMGQCITASVTASAAPQGVSKPGDFIDIPLTTKATWQLDELNHALLYEVWQSAGFDSANIRVWYRPQGRILVTYVDASFYDADSAERGLAEYWRLLSTGGPATPFSAFGVPAGVQTLELRKATTTGQSGQILSIQHGTQVLIAVLSGNPVDEGVTSTLGLDMSEAAG